MRTALPWILLVVVGCGGAQPTPDGEVRLHRLVDAAEMRFETVRPRELFAEALRAGDAGDPARALDLFDRVVRDFPSSRYRDAAAYDAALTLVEMGRTGDAEARARALRDRLGPEAAERLPTELLLLRLARETRSSDEAVAAATDARARSLADEMLRRMLPREVREEVLLERAWILARRSDPGLGAALRELGGYARGPAIAAEVARLEAEFARRRAVARDAGSDENDERGASSLDNPDGAP